MQIIYLCHQFGMSLGIATSIRVSTMLGSGDAVGAKRSRCVRGCARITLETGGLRKKAFSLTVCRDLCVVTGEGTILALSTSLPALLTPTLSIK